MPLGGQDLDEFLMSFHTSGRDPLVQWSTCWEAARQLKEQMCYVAKDYENEFDVGDTMSLAISEGIATTLTHERFKIPEALFNPSLIESSLLGVHQFLCKALHKINDGSVREAVLQNIIVVGGTTLLAGFQGTT